MKSINIAYALLCDKCSRVMHAEDYKKHSPYAYWKCLSYSCENNGKIFRQLLEVVNLEEVQDASL